MQKPSERKVAKTKIEKMAPNITRPVWNDPAMSCEACDYNGQDIDTFPCAKCHTRH